MRAVGSELTARPNTQHCPTPPASQASRRRCVRLAATLLTLTLTLCYAANIFRQPGEDHGAIFFSMRFRDLFR